MFTICHVVCACVRAKQNKNIFYLQNNGLFPKVFKRSWRRTVPFWSRYGKKYYRKNCCTGMCQCLNYTKVLHTGVILVPMLYSTVSTNHRLKWELHLSLPVSMSVISVIVCVSDCIYPYLNQFFCPCLTISTLFNHLQNNISRNNKYVPYCFTPYHASKH